MRTGCNVYQKINTMGMSQLDLILAVYRGTIGYLEQAKEAFVNEKYDIGRTACDKARKCIVHLYTTLDMEKGKEIAHYLGGLYAHTIEQLDLAVASKATGRLDDIIRVLANLREGWEGLRDQKNVNPENKAKENEIKPDAVPDDIELPSSKHNGQITFSA